MSGSKTVEASGTGGFVRLDSADGRALMSWSLRREGMFIVVVKGRARRNGFEQPQVQSFRRVLIRALFNTRLLLDFIIFYSVLFQPSMSSKATASQDDDVDDLDGITYWIIK